jgi:hypothetical protein
MLSNNCSNSRTTISSLPCGTEAIGNWHNLGESPAAYLASSDYSAHIVEAGWIYILHSVIISKYSLLDIFNFICHKNDQRSKISRRNSIVEIVEMILSLFAEDIPPINASLLNFCSQWCRAWRHLYSI